MEKIDSTRWKQLKETVEEVIHPTPPPPPPPEPPKLIVTIELTEFQEFLINIRAKMKVIFGNINKWWTDERKD